MRSMALVCAALLVLACVAAGAMADEIAPDAEAPAPEIHATAAEAPAYAPPVVESDARQTQEASVRHIEWTRADAETSAPGVVGDTATGAEGAAAVRELRTGKSEDSASDAGAPGTEPEAAAPEESGGEAVEPDVGSAEDTPAEEPSADPTEDPESPEDSQTPGETHAPEEPEAPKDAEQPEQPKDPETPEEPEAGEAVPEAPKQESVSRRNTQNALSFSGWDYSDAWDVPGEMDSSGIVTALERTCINTRPGFDSTTMTWVPRGTEMKYLNVTEYDGEGYAWYQIYWDGWTGWVTSHSTRLWWPTYY